MRGPGENTAGAVTGCPTIVQPETAGQRNTAAIAAVRMDCLPDPPVRPYAGLAQAQSRQFGIQASIARNPGLSASASVPPQVARPLRDGGCERGSSWPTTLCSTRYRWRSIALPMRCAISAPRSPHAPTPCHGVSRASARTPRTIRSTSSRPCSRTAKASRDRQVCPAHAAHTPLAPHPPARRARSAGFVSAQAQECPTAGQRRRLACSLLKTGEES